MSIGDICPTCGHDSEQQARFIVLVREVTRLMEKALARAAIAEAKLTLVNLEDKHAYSRAQAKIQRQKQELQRLELQRLERKNNEGMA